MLLILDNLDDLVQNDLNEMKSSFTRLTQDNSSLQILFSTSRYVDGFFVKNLKGLDPLQAKNLFLSKLPSEEVKQ